MFLDNNIFNSFFTNDFLFLIPEIFFIFFILFTIIFFIIYSNSSYYKNPILIITLGFLSLYFFIILTCLLLNSINCTTIALNFQHINTIFSNSIKILITIISFFCFFISFDYIKKEKLYHWEFFILLLLSILGMFLLISSFDFLSFYLALELQSLSFFVIASIKRKSIFSTEAGLKYFILGAFSSAILLFGISLIYGFTGIIFFDDFFLLSSMFINTEDTFLFYGLIIGFFFFSVGLFFKLGAAPFHSWVPDVYEGVPMIVMSFFAIVPKIIFFSFIIQFFYIFCGNLYFFWHNWLIFLSFFSFIFGTLGAIFQIKFKRLLAYSAITQIAFLFLGLSIYNLDALFSIIFYLFIYVLLSLGIFSSLLSLRKYNNDKKIKNILDLKNFFVIHPLFSFFFMFLFFSLAGIPPLCGFFSKFFIFLAALKNDFFLITIVAFIFSVIGSFYYIRLVRLSFFENSLYWIFFLPLKKINTIIITVISFINFLFFIYPNVIFIFIYEISLLFLL